MTKILLIVGILFVIETYVLIIFHKILQKTKDENKQLREVLEMQKKNIDVLMAHAKKLSDIVKNKEKTDAEIHGAKTDEELNEIVNRIINLNNNRL